MSTTLQSGLLGLSTADFVGDGYLGPKALGRHLFAPFPEQESVVEAGDPANPAPSARPAIQIQPLWDTAALRSTYGSDSELRRPSRGDLGPSTGPPCPAYRLDRVEYLDGQIRRIIMGEVSWICQPGRFSPSDWRSPGGPWLSEASFPRETRCGHKGFSASPLLH